MSKIAVVRTGGKQYVVREGGVLKVEKLLTTDNEESVLPDVLLVAETDGSAIELGQPQVKAEVKVKTMRQGRAKKIRVVHYKAKVRHHKVYGHRQPFTELKVVKVG